MLDETEGNKGVKIDLENEFISVCGANKMRKEERNLRDMMLEKLLRLGYNDTLTDVNELSPSIDSHTFIHFYHRIQTCATLNKRGINSETANSIKNVVIFIGTS